MAYLRLILNQRDDISFDRIINVPRRKLGPKSTGTISNYSETKGVSKFEACFELEQMELMPSASKSIENFVSVIEMLMIKKDVMPLGEFILDVMEDTGLKDMLLQDDTVEGRSRVENIDEFLSAAKDFEERYTENSIDDFLAHVSLLADIDKTDSAKDLVTMMTVHSAKGLEFDTVFITGLEDGMFPIIRDDDEDDVEEERRLFYVAITRAKRMLYITHARDRMRFGSHEMRMKSRFLAEIPEECIEESDPLSFGNKKLKQLKIAGKTQITEQEKTKPKSNKFKLGDKIMHKMWGVGTVVQLKDDIIVIAFENKGIKNLNLEYAPIEKI
jgi:DNA helicase-2/ATP-dependent DNA helicase PcrA